MHSSLHISFITQMVWISFSINLWLAEEHHNSTYKIRLKSLPKKNKVKSFVAERCTAAQEAIPSQVINDNIIHQTSYICHGINYKLKLHILEYMTRFGSLFETPFYWGTI